MHGKKQAGKDTAFQRLHGIYADTDTVERLSFADKLYESAAAALGLDVSDLYEFKIDSTVRIEVYKYQNKQGPRGGRRIHAIDFRKYLQRYGTEAHRDVFDTNFWVDAVDLKNHMGKIVVVTDVRFPNEAEAIRKAGGVVVRIVGPPEVEEAGDGHASEVPLEDVDFVIHNGIRTTFDALDDELMKVVATLRRREEKKPVKKRKRVKTKT